MPDVEREAVTVAVPTDSAPANESGPDALLDQRVWSRLLVCWSLSHGYRLSLDNEHELVKKCNTF